MPIRPPFSASPSRARPPSLSGRGSEFVEQRGHGGVGQPVAVGGLRERPHAPVRVGQDVRDLADATQQDRRETAVAHRGQGGEPVLLRGVVGGSADQARDERLEVLRDRSDREVVLLGDMVRAAPGRDRGRAGFTGASTLPRSRAPSASRSSVT